MSVCEQNQQHLSDFLDGTLDAQRSVTIKAHLEDCSTCRREYNALKNTIAMLHAAETPDGSFARRRAISNLRAGIRAGAPPQRRTLMGMRLIPIGAAVAASLAWIMVTRNPNAPISGTSSQHPFVSSVAVGKGLPTSLELDEMASQHALHSFAVAAGDACEQQETLADATSRISGGNP